MNLAAILAFYLLTFAWSPPLVRGFASQETQQNPKAPTDSSSPAPQAQGDNSAPPPQASPAKKDASAKPAPSSTAQTPNSAGQAQAHVKRRRNAKNTIYPDCTISPAPLHPTPGDTTNSAQTRNSTSNGADSTNSGSPNSGAVNATSTKGSTKTGSAPLKPCPPPKKVVRDGGSDEPTIQLMGTTPAEQASRQRSTDELRAATEENLKKIEDRELSPTQRDMVSQIKQFMEQSRTAVASGDAERGHNLAMKARLLSDELVKP
jgi:hypothetical protein